MSYWVGEDAFYLQVVAKVKEWSLIHLCSLVLPFQGDKLSCFCVFLFLTWYQKQHLQFPSRLRTSGSPGTVYILDNRLILLTCKAVNDLIATSLWNNRCGTTLTVRYSSLRIRQLSGSDSQVWFNCCYYFSANWLSILVFVYSFYWFCSSQEWRIIYLKHIQYFIQPSERKKNSVILCHLDWCL